MLKTSPSERLGAGIDLDNNIDALKDHPFFSGINFSNLGKAPLDPMTLDMSPTKKKMLSLLPHFSAESKSRSDKKTRSPLLFSSIAECPKFDMNEDYFKDLPEPIIDFKQQNTGLFPKTAKSNLNKKQELFQTSSAGKGSFGTQESKPLKLVDIARAMQATSIDDEDITRTHSRPMEIISDVVLKKVKVFFFAERKLSLNYKGELLYYKKEGTGG